MMVVNIKNLDTARTMVRQLAVRQLVTGLIRQYGFDELMTGVHYCYRENVLAPSRHNPEVQRRAAVLDEAIRNLQLSKGGNDEAHTS
jgi:hypothetical protein